MDLPVADELSEPVELGASIPPQPHGTSVPGSLPQLRDRRREKPLLSCTFCRGRKVRCDRQLPCKTCADRGIASTCSYRTRTPGSKSKVSVGDRIHQLEALVRSLAQQQQHSLGQQYNPEENTGYTDGPAINSAYSPNSTPVPGTSPSHLSTTIPLASIEDGDIVPPVQCPPQKGDYSMSTAPSEHGSIRLNSHGTNYVGSFHWAAVLDSISDLRDHYEEEEAARLLEADDHVHHENSGPRLLYEPVQTTKPGLLAAIPPRPAIDRMVARYFNAEGVVPEILHRGHFLKEYEAFWQEPSAVSVAWVGLLFSVMTLSTLYQRSIEGSEDPDALARVHVFRENVIHSLVLCQWTKGGDYVLETLILYLTSELFLSRNSEIGLWLVQGMLVQLSLSHGYHRDPRNFPGISPFAGEMRRRVWAVIVQIDLRLSSQMTLPRLLKLHQYDTTEPRNLFDTDFDENTTKLPESRPETEVTPVLYSLARARIDKMNALVNDLVNDTQEHPYEEIIDLDHKLQHAEASLSPVFRWQPLSQSFMILPRIIMHRVLLQLAIQRVSVWLHRKYLTPSYVSAQYTYSRSACMNSAMKILEFQKIVEEETQKDGLLYPVRWMFTSSRLKAVFLLGTSILCYYFQSIRMHSGASLGETTDNAIRDLLENVYHIWLRSSAVCPEARRVVQILNSLLEMGGQKNSPSPVAALSIDPPSSSMGRHAFSLDQSAWELYEDSTAIAASMPAFSDGSDHGYSGGPILSSPAAPVSMADLLLSNNDFDQWMNLSFNQG